MNQPEDDDFTSISVGQLNELFARLQQLENQRVVPLSAPVSASATEPRIADPTPFSGKRHELHNFLSKCRLKFAGQPSRFKSESSKIYYLGSYLTDQAYSWFQPLLSQAQDPNQPDPPEFLSFDALAASLTAAYGDPNLRRASERAIRALKQSKMYPPSVSQYAMEFKAARQHVTWDDSSLMDHFYEGLTPTVKDFLCPLDEPKSLNDLIALAIKIDSRDYDRKLEKKQETAPPKKPSSSVTPQAPSSRPSYPSASFPRASFPVVTADGTIPMDNSANRITPEEREHRRVNNLCFYCGSADHKRVNCPKRPMRPAQLNSGVIQIPPESSVKDTTQE